MKSPTPTFGANKSVLNNSSFHRVREAIAARLMTHNFIVPGADVISKVWDYSKVWQTLEFILFWGDERYYGFHRRMCSVLEDSCPGADRWGVLKLRSVIRVMSLQEQCSLLRRRSGCTRTQLISLPVTDPRAHGEYYA